MYASPSRVAVVEDDLDLRRDLVRFLGHRGFLARGFESAEEFAAQELCSFELVVLDVGLPGRNGLELLATLKRNENPPAVVLLTAYGADTDHVNGLDAGADAYLVKGASLQVIEATCRSVLRARTTQPPQYWQLREEARTLTTPTGLTVELTHQEVSFLRPLLSARGKAVSRERLLEALGSTPTLTSLRNLDNCAARLRKKVSDLAGQALPLRASYGTGYIFLDDSSV